VTDGAAGVRPARPLLRQRNFGALWWGQLISILGERFTYLALLGLLSTYTDHFRDPNSSLLLTLLANLMLLPVLLFAPFTGAWLDRVNLKRVMVVSDLLRAGLVALIPVAYAATHLMAPVFALVFLLFLCNVFFLPAKSALTPEIVPESQLIGANALLSGAGIAATAVGALAGGWVVDHMGCSSTRSPTSSRSGRWPSSATAGAPRTSRCRRCRCAATWTRSAMAGPRCSARRPCDSRCWRWAPSGWAAASCTSPATSTFSSARTFRAWNAWASS
jgi:MFS family permease